MAKESKSASQILMTRFWTCLVAALALAGCDTSDPLGHYPEPAKEVVAPLELTGRVVDAADLLNQRQEQELAKRLRSIETGTLAQLVVVTTPSLDGLSIEDYSLALGRGWGIGDEVRNDGLLIVVAPNERQVRIEVGRGLENTVDDLFAKEVIDGMIHFLRDDRFHDAVAFGVDRLEARLRQSQLKEAA